MTPKLTAIQRLRIQTRHRVSIENYGYQPQALFWSSQEIQEIRFQKLIEILPQNYFKLGSFEDNQAWSLLDVGCGFADLQRYMLKRGLFSDYSGIDVSADMVRGAKGMAPELNVLEGELSDFDYVTEQFDYVMLSGALNEVVETEVEGLANQQGRYARSVIARMYQLCRYGVAFNLLDRRFAWHETRTDLQSFYPQEIMEYCHSFANQVTLVEGYLENDFTVYLHKPPSGQRG
ncbi:class I SAM-dependent methyltransferase [Thiomicrorhabdus arctica]|jgi:SAM-dependent methyltransferase|uniref:class I SAM-dependent methyltransferase n=1 Tax=Thiomicrorhabdus arctica TaxID=131540 RepID=UPI00035F8956|nr:class I SAM-dependent methyltransferase [Thiomicrorhabdus arctica]